MKKRFGVLVGIVVMVVGVVMEISLTNSVGASSIAKSTDEAKKICESKGWEVVIHQVYSDKTASYSCKTPPVPQGKYTKEKADDICPCGSHAVWTGTASIQYECDSCNSDNLAENPLPTKPTNSNDKNEEEDDDDSENINGGGNANESIQNKHDNTVETNLFGNVDVGSDGGGVFMVLNVILQVLTWGVGIAGTAGIIFTGIQYMTAKDDVAQLTKAKNRLIQIVIGLAAYAVMWAFLQWLLPGGIFGN